MIKDRVQVRGPKSPYWLKIDVKYGRILGYKKDRKPWKNVKKKKRIKLNFKKPKTKLDL